MKQIEVQIMGNGYLLGVPEGGEARLHAAVRRVDSAMCRIRDSGKLKARDRIAVLAALNLAFDLADRDGAATAAPTSRAPASAPSSALAPPPPSTLQTESDPLLAQLLQRLDAALASDGQLL